jgi:F-type H+-transporting ATPase subunit delta
MSRVAGRYAKSLIELAQERGVLQSVMGDIEYFLEATKNRDLAMLLQSPIIAADKKQSILEELKEWVFVHKFQEFFKKSFPRKY